MSTILDALKKSEQERNSSNVPVLTTMQAPEETRRYLPYALGAACISLVIAVAAGIFIYMQNTRVDQSTNQISEQHEYRVDVISFSDDAEKRFAIIDGSVYREGGQLAEGIVLEVIKPQSVTLIVDGQQRVLLAK